MEVLERLTRREQGGAPAPGRRSRRGRRVLIASVAGAAVLGGVLVLLPWGAGD
ncbi:hypothetical protein GTY88_07500, partial [Streptomyces sp. SID5926]|nr:hypothetical protein [Streptomyces sp. SID5926]